MNIWVFMILLSVWAVVLIFSSSYEKKKHIIKHIKWHISLNIIATILPWIDILIVIALKNYNNLFNLLVKYTLIVYGIDFGYLIVESFYLYLKPVFHKLNYVCVLIGAIIFYSALIALGYWFVVILQKYVKTVSAPITAIIYISIFGSLCSVLNRMILYCNDYNEFISVNDDKRIICSSDRHKKQAKSKNFRIKLYELMGKCIGVIYPVLIILYIYKSVNKKSKLYLITHTIKFKFLLTPETLNYADIALALLLFSFIISLVLYIFVNIIIKKYYSDKSWTQIIGNKFYKLFNIKKK